MSPLTSVSAPRNISTTANINAPASVKKRVQDLLRHLLAAAWLQVVVKRADPTSFSSTCNVPTKEHIPTWRVHITSSTVVPLFQKSLGDEFGLPMLEVDVKIEQLWRRLGDAFLRSRLNRIPPKIWVYHVKTYQGWKNHASTFIHCSSFVGKLSSHFEQLWPLLYSVCNKFLWACIRKNRSDST